MAASSRSITASGLRRDIASGALASLYLVTGPDELDMSRLAAELTQTIPEDLRAFNVHRFHGTDKVTLAQVLDAASAYPLLAPRRIVLLLQAEKILTKKRGRAGGDEEPPAPPEGSDEKDQPAAVEEEPQGPRAIDLLKEYAAAPHPHATVAIFGAGLGRTFDSVGGRAVSVSCEAQGDPLSELAAGHGVRFHPAAAQLLRQRAGEDLERLKADAERVLLYAAGSPVVTREQVEAVVGRQAAAGGGALWGAVAKGRTSEALKELELELAEGAVPFMVLGLFRSVVERTMTGPELPAALDALLRTDLALKSSGGDPQVLLQRLVVELCRPGNPRAS
ncbi:MAG TPA: hypothetical protein VK911_04640 [Vicinamibacterales bacterium]|nr:hypothetical protein [Vicinamibacterales bacterium]